MADFRKSKLDFANPLVPNANDIAFDFNDLIDKTTTNFFLNDAIDVYTRRNIFKGVREYIGLVIQVSVDYTPPGIIDLIQNTFGENTKQTYFKAHIPTLHASIGNPCDSGYLERFGTSQERVQAALKRIQNHPWFLATYSASLFSNRAPTFGDIVKIKFLKDPASGKMIQGEIVEILSRGNGESLDDLCGDSSKNLFGGYNPNFGSPLVPLDQTTSSTPTAFAGAPVLALKKEDPVKCPASGRVVDCKEETKRSYPTTSIVCFYTKQRGSGINFNPLKNGKNNYRAGFDMGDDKDPPLISMTPEMFKELKECFGIQTIITLASDHGNNKTPSFVKQAGLNSYKFEMSGDHGMRASEWQQVFQLLSQGNTLIHCTHGADRTGAAVGRFYVESRFMNSEQAIQDAGIYGSFNKSNYEFPNLVKFVREGPFGNWSGK